jgi:pimeloyl-ACP methyl ester carboxylesterase
LQPALVVVQSDELEMLALAREHRVFALDLLGYGSSDRPDVNYSVTLETGILRQFLESQGL